MAVSVSAEAQATEASVPGLLWLDLTRQCQLECVHCYNASGPDGTHGSMTREHWIGVLDQSAACGVGRVQLIGGEPTLHPEAPGLVTHALGLGLDVEVFSNLVHVSGEWWELLELPGMSLATSYYADQAAQHNAMTRRPSHARTRANIAKAVRLGIPLRVGIITSDDDQDTAPVRRELRALGVKRIGVDRVRPFGRGAYDAPPDPSGLCGQCGSGRASVGPDGQVSPCVFSTWMGVGNVQQAPLAAILGGPAMAGANATIRAAARGRTCEPRCEPNAECSPGFPGSGCGPRN